MPGERKSVEPMAAVVAPARVSAKHAYGILIREREAIPPQAPGGAKRLTYSGFAEVAILRREDAARCSVD